MVVPRAGGSNNSFDPCLNEHARASGAWERSSVKSTAFCTLYAIEDRIHFSVNHHFVLQVLRAVTILIIDDISREAVVPRANDASFVIHNNGANLC